MGRGRVREGYSGTGPGPITPDGCAVELYQRLTVGDEPDVIGRFAPAGGSILELGCGVGRVTHPLVDRGFAVTAVDESPDMLARVHGARTVCSPIEELDLGERFDVVLLASFLVHAGDPARRQGLLRACRRHVAGDGCVLLQREGRSWHGDVPREHEIPGGLVRVVSSVPAGPGVQSVHIEYVFPDATWTQTFLSRPLTTAQFEEALAQAGLGQVSYPPGDGTWARAVPLPED
jgi:SAM-dependent methyltransferase